MKADEILEAIHKCGLSVEDELRKRFDWDAVGSYYDFLRDENERGGFFSKGDSDKILERHVYECLVFVDYVARQALVSRETTVCDAGSGPGLPGYLFACLVDRPRLTLVDSSRRRLGLLEQYDAQRGSRTKFLYARLEELALTFDVITLRALIPYPFSVELLTRLQKPGGQIFLSLGKAPAAADLLRFGYVSRETYHPRALETLGARTFLHIAKVQKQDSLYPRPWKIIQEEIRSCRESMQ